MFFLFERPRIEIDSLGENRLELLEDHPPLALHLHAAVGDRATRARPGCPTFGSRPRPFTRNLMACLALPDPPWDWNSF